MSAMRAEKMTFTGADKTSRLAARLDLPHGEPRAFALFAHCFTCTHNVFAATRIAQRLRAHGIAVLRFDFTGLGASEGEFANTNFSSNVGDLLAAAEWLRSERKAPELLIGHSLGGAAVLAAAKSIPEARGVCTIARSRRTIACGPPFSAGDPRDRGAGRGGGATRRTSVPHSQAVSRGHRSAQAG